uniref:Uncharacterized protein n=1 Tax=Vespula pensylvanica TaxID=30213 RepID=A0A834UGE4_VESPE|nr:hypothetical protein H0235_000620 [Vespula pensylvanica]
MAEKLREACVRGEAERVARLLDEGIKPQPDENGRSPLLLAAALGHTDVCNALLLREAEVNAADSKEKKKSYLIRSKELSREKTMIRNDLKKQSGSPFAYRPA